MPLTAAKINAAKPKAKLYKLSDSHGLQLWISPDGAKRWRYAFRFDDKQKQLAIGVYPDISLLEARAALTKAREQVKSGVDPSQQRRVEKLVKLESNANTFDLIGAELVAKKKREGKSESTLNKTTWLISLASPIIGNRPISDITAPEVLAALRTAENRGRLDTATRMRSTIGEVFRYAIQTNRAKDDPTLVLRGALTAPTVKHRAAILDPKGVGGLLRAIDSYDSLDVRAALQLLILNMTRPSELRLALWREFDLEKATWIIPAGRMKMRDEHRIPLSRQALDILKGLQKLSGSGELVFPSYRAKDRPMSEATMNAALKRLGYSSDQVQPHGFRVIGSSLLNESGKFSPDAIERAQSRKVSGEIRSIYNRGGYWDERVRMAQYWADYLDTLRVGAQIVQFGKAASDGGNF